MPQELAVAAAFISVYTIPLLWLLPIAIMRHFLLKD